MPENLLWINKDSGSKVLSRSSKQETRQIRKHVQHERQVRARALQNESKGPPTPAKSPRARNDSLTQKLKPLVAMQREDLRLDTHPDEESSSPAGSEAGIQQMSVLASCVSPTSYTNLLGQAMTSFPALDPKELRSLVFFCQRTAPEWSGWRDASFWNKLLLQAAHMNQPILHGVVALGALHESSEVDGESDDKMNLRELALLQSSKATRMAVETSMSDIATLISCIIFICLQNLQDSHTAYQLLRSGWNLICDIDERIASGSLLLTDSETAVLNSFVRPIIERLRMRFCSIVDPPSALAISAGLKRDKSENRAVLPDIPSWFGSLLDARNKLEVIVEWAQENINPSVEQCPAAVTVQTTFDEWRTALENTRIEPHGPLMSSKKLLKAASIMAKILFATLGTHEECPYDSFVDQFAEILELYNEAIGEPAKIGRRVSFGIDSGVIDTLVFVAGRCRDPIVRRAAINLLEITNRNEGDLQGTTGSNIMQALMEIEENGLDVKVASDVPERNRVRIWEDHQYWDTGEIIVYFVKWPYDPSMGAEVIQASVQLPRQAFRLNKEIASPSAPLPGGRLPNVKYGRGAGAFLEEGTQTYHQINLTSFFMPIPRL